MACAPVRRYASAINEIFEFSADPTPFEVLEELKQVKKLLEEWEEADDYIDAPEELSMLVSGLREDYDEAEDRIEQLESELLDSRESFNLQDQSDNFYLHGAEYTDEETNEPLTLKDVWELRADAYKSHRKIEELEEKVEECKDITMDNLITAEEEGDETLEEYVKRRIDKYILEGSLHNTEALLQQIARAESWEDSYNELKEENEYAHKSLEFVRNTLTEPIQEAVPPS